MEWTVYYYSINSKKIKTFNVFDHNHFMEAVKNHLRKCTSRDELADALKREAMYYFWGKCEWEILLKPWTDNSGEPVKIDVYSQLQMNWDRFVDYVWENRRKK